MRERKKVEGQVEHGCCYGDEGGGRLERWLEIVCSSCDT